MDGGEEDTELDYAGRERDDVGRNDAGRDDVGRDGGELTTERIAADGKSPAITTPWTTTVAEDGLEVW
jgi:hypothetical protein